MARTLVLDFDGGKCIPAVPAGAGKLFTVDVKSRDSCQSWRNFILVEWMPCALAVLPHQGHAPDRGFFYFNSNKSRCAMGLLQLTGALVFFDGGGDWRREARPLVVREGSRGVVVIFLFSGSFVLFGLDSCPCILYVRICTRMFSLPSNTDTYYKKK